MIVGVLLDAAFTVTVWGVRATWYTASAVYAYARGEPSATAEQRIEWVEELGRLELLERLERLERKLQKENDDCGSDFGAALDVAEIAIATPSSSQDDITFN